MTGFVDESEVADRKYTDYTEIDTLPDHFAATVKRLAASKAQLKALEAEVKAMAEDLLAEMATLAEDYPRIQVDNVRLTRAKGSNTRIDPKILLSKGVPAPIIAEATIVKPYEYVLVRTVEA